MPNMMNTVIVKAGTGNIPVRNKWFIIEFDFFLCPFSLVFINNTFQDTAYLFQVLFIFILRISPS